MKIPESWNIFILQEIGIQSAKKISTSYTQKILTKKKLKKLKI